MADVNAQRFPSGFARRKPRLPLAGKIVKEIDVESLAERPYVIARKKAQRSIRCAQKWIRKNEFEKAAGMIRRAQEHLRQLP